MELISEVLKQITSVLESLAIPYAIGGSIASGSRGIWRTTMDIDIVAYVRPSQIDALAAALGPDWYVDADMIRSAIAAGRSFNLIQRRFAYKVDIFPPTTEFHHRQLERATPFPVGPDAVLCSVATAEDILLAKLRWYLDGGEVSDRQWTDICGIIATNPPLDLAYLQLWAARLGVTRLLEKAQADVRAG